MASGIASSRLKISYQDNFHGRSKTQQVSDVRTKYVWLRLEEPNAKDGVTEAVEESEVGLILEPPDVDVWINGQPRSIDFREKSYHAVALNVAELLNLSKMKMEFGLVPMQLAAWAIRNYLAKNVQLSWKDAMFVNDIFAVYW